MIKGVIQVENPADIKMSLTITASIREWEIILNDFVRPSQNPTIDVKTLIRKLISKSKETFFRYYGANARRLLNAAVRSRQHGCAWLYTRHVDSHQKCGRPILDPSDDLFYAFPAGGC